MPMVLLHAYSVMLPRLEAENDLRMWQALSMGSGWAKSEDVRNYVKGLQKIANGGKAPPRKFQTPRQAALAMGIPIVKGGKSSS